MVLLSRLQVSEIKKLLNLDDTQTALLEKKFCIDMSDIEDKVFYSYCIKYDKYGNTKSGEGIIKKEFYEYLKRDHARHPKRVYHSREVEKYVYIRIRFSALKFSDDINMIEKFYLGDEYDANIFRDLALNSDDDEYDSNKENDSESDDY